LPLLDGSTALLSPEDRPPELVKEVRAKILCGICEKKHEAGISWGKESHGICKQCTPWLILALKREQCLVDNAERAEVYAKIKRIREALEKGFDDVTVGSQMPYWAYAERWAERYQRNSKQSSWGVYFAHYRHLLLYFEDMPIGEIDSEEVAKFREYLLELPGIHGKRSRVTADKTLKTLRRILKEAVEQGWLPTNPVNGVIVSRLPGLKDSPRLKVEDEDKLLAECKDEFLGCREQIIYLADTGARELHRQKLSWPDVRFDEGLIKCSGGLIKMTPRLSRAMRDLWERSGRPVEGLVWSPQPALKTIFPKLCAAAEIEKLQLIVFTRTAAFRMQEMGADSLRIAEILGRKDLSYIPHILDVDPEFAQQQRDSPRFQQFLIDELGASAQAQIGDGHVKKATQRLDRAQFLKRVKKFILEAWSSKKPKMPTREDIAKKFAARGLRPTTGAGVKDSLIRCGVTDDWDVFLRQVLTEAGKL